MAKFDNCHICSHCDFVRPTLIANQLQDCCLDCSLGSNHSGLHLGNSRGFDKSVADKNLAGDMIKQLAVTSSSFL